MMIGLAVRRLVPGARPHRSPADAMHGLLSILIWLPIAAGLAVVLLGDRTRAGRWLRCSPGDDAALSVRVGVRRHRHRALPVPGKLP